MTLRTLSIAAAVATVMLAPTAGFAAKQHNSNRHVTTHTSRTHHGARTTTRHVRTTTRRHVTNGARHRTRAARHRNVVVHKNVVVHRNVRVGHRYYGGYWYGPQRHYWRGRWYAYGVGSCWLPTPIGFVWVCGV
jgi:hypothetical protein